MKLAEHAYPEHNLEFIVVCERMTGDVRGSQRSARALVALAESFLASGRDGYEAIFPYERFVVTALQNAVVFGEWDSLLPSSSPSPSATGVIADIAAAPPARRVFHRAHYHWAQGQRLVARGAAREQTVLHLRALEAARAEMEHSANVVRYSADLYPARQLLAILSLWLRAAMALQQHHSVNGVNNDHNTHDDVVDSAPHDDHHHLALLREAFNIEHSLFYDEPPSQFFATAVVLGDCLLHSQRNDEARTVYEQALHTYPGHAWLLYGLASACERLGDVACSESAREGFARVWNATTLKTPQQHICACNNK